MQRLVCGLTAAALLATATPLAAQSNVEGCLIDNHSQEAEAPMRELILAKLDKQPKSATRPLEVQVAEVIVGVALSKCGVSSGDLKSSSFKSASKEYAKWLAKKLVAEGLK